jgi:RNA polymerase sigma-70 factor (ECF subfamily)
MTTELFNEEFAGIKGALRSYLLRMTASVADAEDLVHDTYLKGRDKLDSFRGESSLKTWLFAIASNLAKDNLRFRKRWAEDVTDICRQEAKADPAFFSEAMHIQATSPQGTFEIKEHIVFCFTCISKSLPLEQQLCIFLKEVYEFRMNEIAEILDTTLAMVKYYLHTGRARMIQVFDGRCALINKEGVCHQCSELNGVYNPKQRFNEEVAKIELARQHENADKEYLLDLRLQLIKDIDPFESPAAALQLHHLEHNRLVMDKFS